MDSPYYSPILAESAITDNPAVVNKARAASVFRCRIRAGTNLALVMQHGVENDESTQQYDRADGGILIPVWMRRGWNLREPGFAGAGRPAGHLAARAGGRARDAHGNLPWHRSDRHGVPNP